MDIKKWIRITLFSLFIVALLGVLLRYKITFSLPFINQKYLQHSHSHFAMYGWLSQLLMVLMASSVSKSFPGQHFKKYNFVLILNIIASFGMLVSFLMQGYGPVSIAFSTLSVIVSYYFAVQLWRDMNRAPRSLPSFRWYKAAIVFSIISSFGIAMLVYLMVTKNVDINLQQATTYFFLHFQYNGWFIFACFGLLINLFLEKGFLIKNEKTFFWAYAVACLPAYFLSTLWMPLPVFIYLLIIISAAILLFGWLWFYSSIKGVLKDMLAETPVLGKWLLALSAIAFTIKVILQAGSIVPSLNSMAFGYRPIVIGYLHLVFLGVITIFLLGYLVYSNYLKVTKTFTIGSVIFVSGVILNELALMVQGLTAMRYYNISSINEILLGITAMMLTGLFIMNIAKQK